MGTKRSVYAIWIELDSGNQFVGHSFDESFEDACDLFAKTVAAEPWAQQWGEYAPAPPRFGQHQLFEGRP